MSETKKSMPELLKKALVKPLGAFAVIFLSANVVDYYSYSQDPLQPCDSISSEDLKKTQETIEAKENQDQNQQDINKHNLRLANSLGIYVLSVHRPRALEHAKQQVNGSRNIEDATYAANNFTQKHFDFKTELAKNENDLPLKFLPISYQTPKDQELTKNNINNFLDSFSQMPADLIQNIDLDRIVFVKDIIEPNKEIAGKDLTNGTLVLDIDNLKYDEPINHELGHRFDAKFCKSSFGMLNDYQFSKLQPRWLNQEKRQRAYRNQSHIEYNNEFNSVMVDTNGLENDAEDKANTYEVILDNQLPNSPIIKRKITLLTARLNKISLGSGSWFMLKKS